MTRAGAAAIAEMITAPAGPRLTGGSSVADLPSPVSFQIPMPPSTNNLFKNVRGVGRVKTKTYDDFTMMAVTAIRRQKVKPIAGYVVILFAFELASSQADVSNRIKAAEDAIVKAGVIDDDRFVTAMMVTKVPAANGLAHVQIFPIQQFTLDFHPSHSGASGAMIIRAPQPNGEDNGYRLE
jgi:Holliday junction resolvase RusA-like endonuclease